MADPKDVSELFDAYGGTKSLQELIEEFACGLMLTYMDGEFTIVLPDRVVDLFEASLVRVRPEISTNIRAFPPNKAAKLDTSAGVVTIYRKSEVDLVRKIT